MQFNVVLSRGCKRNSPPLDRATFYFMDTEIWKDVEWYEWVYEISNLWRVKSLRFWKEKIIKFWIRSWYLSFWSIMEAERETWTHHADISYVCKGKNKSAGWFIWKYTF